MGLFTVSIDDADRERVDRLVNVLERIATLAETVVNQKEVIIRIGLVNQQIPPVL